MAALWRLFIAVVIFAALALAWLVSTTGGARWLAERIMDQQPALQVTVEAGSLLDGLTLREIAWTDRELDLDLRIDKAVLRWQPECLLEQVLCLDTLHLSSVNLRVAEQVQFVDYLLAEARFDFAARTIDAALQVLANETGRLQSQLNGSLEAHRLALSFESDDAKGVIALQGGLDEAFIWRGEIAQAQVASPAGDWTLEGTPALSVASAPTRLTLAAHCWAGQPLRLCTQPIDITPEAGQIDLKMDTLALEVLQPWLPDTVRLPGSVEGSASLTWAPNAAPRARLTLDSADAAIEVSVDEGERPIVLSYQRVVGDVDLTTEQIGLRVGIASRDIGTGGFAFYLNDPLTETGRLSGSVWLDGVDLSPIAGALSAVRMASGRLRATGQLSGTRQQPNFIGQLSVSGATVLPAEIVNPIEDINLDVALQGDVAILEGRFSAGAGEGALTGVLGWSEGLLRGALRITGELLEIDQGSLVKLAVSPDIAVRLALDSISVSGNLQIPFARIELAAPPTAAVRVSRDAVIVDAAGEPLEAVLAPARTISSHVTVQLGDDVQFAGFGASGSLTGALQLRQIGEVNAEAEGILELVDARYEIYNQRLSIRRGRLIFAGPIAAPRLDIEAVREEVDVMAGVRVTGSPADPSITLFSNPYMEQSHILAYLLTGRPPGAATPSEEALLAQAALSLGILGGGTLGTALAEQLGIRDFQLEARGQGEDAQVAISGYVAPNLLVRYGVNMFQPQNTLSLRYYLNPQLYLEAVTGADSTVDVIYSFNYD